MEKSFTESLEKIKTKKSEYTDIIRELADDEVEAIQGYDKAIIMFNESDFSPEVLEKFKHIKEEELEHVRELKEILINLENYKNKGTEENEEEISWEETSSEETKESENSESSEISDSDPLVDGEYDLEGEDIIQDDIVEESLNESCEEKKHPHLDALIAELNKPFEDAENVEGEFDLVSESPGIFDFRLEYTDKYTDKPMWVIYDANEEYSIDYDEDSEYELMDLAKEFGFEYNYKESETIGDKLEKAAKEDFGKNVYIDWLDPVIMIIADVDCYANDDFDEYEKNKFLK